MQESIAHLASLCVRKLAWLAHLNLNGWTDKHFSDGLGLRNAMKR